MPTHAKEINIDETCMDIRHFKQVSSFDELNKGALLEQCLPKLSQLSVKFFVLVGDVHKLPRETQSKTADCTCHVPWNQRSSWDRRGFVQYKLPAATSLWKSQSLRLSGDNWDHCLYDPPDKEAHETV